LTNRQTSETAEKNPQDRVNHRNADQSSSTGQKCSHGFTCTYALWIAYTGKWKFKVATVNVWKNVTCYWLSFD